MAFLGFGQKPKTINNVAVTQSSQGYPIPVVMGQAKTHTSLLFMGAMQEQQQPGAKGMGKGGTYLYYAPVVAALCNGEVVSIGNVWTGQTWLQTGQTTEPINIQQHYSPSNAAILVSDNGVALVNTYSQTYTDYGQPASTVLSGSDNAPMVQVPYNYALSPAANSAALTTGQYSISFSSIGTFNLTAVANASGGDTVYTGTFSSPSGASNGFVGFKFTTAGFTHGANNGTFTCTASSATSLTLNNAGGVAETHAGTAEDIGNTYHFSSADTGKSAQVFYQFNYSQILQQNIAVVPTSTPIGGTSIPYSVQLSNQYSPTSIVNVQYYGENNPNAGVTLTEVSGTPTAAGTYQFFSSVTISGVQYTYVVFSAADLASEVLITWAYTNQSAVGPNAPELINFELFGGGQGQAEWAFLVDGGTWQLGGGSSNVAKGTMAGNPGEALGYTGIAYVGYGPMFLGASGQVQDNTFEVMTPDSFGGGIPDCNPVQCIYQVLTNKMWGLGKGAVPFPLSAIDNGPSGTWGGAPGSLAYSGAAPGTRLTGSTAWNWFAANNFFISPKIDSQDSASSIIGEWLEAGMCAAFMSEGLLKLVPYGSTSVAGNGNTWVGPQSYIVALDDSCFLSNPGADPVTMERNEWQDAYNKVQIGFSNRANQYEGDICQEWDQASINRWGERIEDPKSWSFIRTLASATFAGTMRVKRFGTFRNTYTFRLPYSYSYLEPMDIVTLTTSSIWAAGLNNVNLGVNDLPVRITKIVDDPAKGLTIKAEDYIAPAAEPVLFNKAISGGSVTPNALATPGNSEVVMFEAPTRLTQQKGNEIRIGACGANSNWGGCNIWVSQDGSNYKQVGTIESPARLGVLASHLASGSDPDTTNTMVVQLAENCAALDAGTTTDADSDNTLCYVDGELISYSACALSGNNEYSMGTYLRRGQMGSLVGSHASGGLFLRLDDSVFSYTYDPNWAGQTLYFKFQSFNQFGQNPQLLPSLTAVQFTVPGKNPGTIEASSGLIINPSQFDVGAGNLGWSQATVASNAGISYYLSSSYPSLTGGGPVPAGVNGSNFYGRTTGYLVPSVTGLYTIGLNYDDGANLYIGGVPIVSQLSASGAANSTLVYRSSGQLYLTAGLYYPIVIEWQQNTGGYALQLIWTPPKGSPQLVPAANTSTSEFSLTSTLSTSFWNGTPSLWYPTGNNASDNTNPLQPAFSPPENAGTGTYVVSSVQTVSSRDTAGSGGNNVTTPGWFSYQGYVTGGQLIDMFLYSGSGHSGYFFRLDGRSGFAIGQILNVTNNTTSSFSNIGTSYVGNNASNLTGWFQVDCYYGNGYMAIWVNGVKCCDVQDNTYAIPNTAQTFYGYGIPAVANPKIGPSNAGGQSGTTSLNGTGNLMQVSSYTFSYASTPTSITWSWTAFTIYCPDGSTISVSSGSYTVFSGLTANTGYYFGMYYNLLTAQVVVVLSDVTSGKSPESTAQITQVVNADNNVPIATDVSASTPTSGTGGGGGGGGAGQAGCFSGSVRVKTPTGYVAFRDLPHRFTIVNDSGTWPARLVVHENMHEIMLDMGNGELVTMGHALKDGDADVPACDVYPDAKRVEYDGTLYNLSINGPDPYYILENGARAHNVLKYV